ncbi:MAG: type II toxin-antitoxin system VapC family toxin [Acidobacteria bacterium]|nr:type II toxin-antitoxin system VapC family toxin [Acidobacteriota bacterium]MYF14268.1 type II toxin-antitoxin system VapC family toxin [Acidobacteriota bacterium]MYI96551.1 type II toxin-antitoxin system VapC family toxin [Acidobacteriota bacterium]
MTVVDLNVLLYAVNSSSRQHPVARGWLESAIASHEPTGLAWTVLLGFLRLTTRPGILPRPLRVEEASEVISDWLDQPGVRLVMETDEHWLHLRRLLASSGTGGNLTMDAHLAALAISHGATLVSFDNDFARFPVLSWLNLSTTA